MTIRGLCLLIPALLGAAAGLLTSNSSLSLLSLAVVLWIMAEWLWFQWRVISEVRSLVIHRTVNNRANSTGICFCGRPLRVSVTVRRTRGQLQPWTRIRDLVPDILTVTQGSSIQVVVNAEKQLMFQYQCCPQAAGVASFPGCRIRIQDANGFFLSDRFVRTEQTLRILPSYESKTEACPQIKRLNGLPQHGIHRLNRAGMGSELLELREYVPGDPPKLIAWKVSARRGKLMTREYESEVPVRTVIFVDNSTPTRLGPWGSRQCDTSSRLAASLARAALTAGDPAGLVVFSESKTKRIPPGWGERSLFRILEMLAASCCTDAPAVRWTAELQDQAMEVCHERYPELLDSSVNKLPWTLFPMTPWQRRVANTRARLASVLCQVHRLSTTDWAKLLYDDDFMGRHLSELMTVAGRRPHSISTSEQNRSAILSDTLQQLGEALRQSVGKARDNEHYVIVCDLLDAEHLLPIIRPVIQLARARYHRLGFVCPMPSSHAISGNGNDPPTAPILLHEAWQIELLERRDRLTRQLRSLGAAVAFPDRDHPVSMTLATLNLARRSQARAGAF